MSDKTQEPEASANPDPTQLDEIQLEAAVGGTTLTDSKLIIPCVKVIIPCIKVAKTI